ncbi:hypothetical protein PIB30_057849 [Stylosanthes scabra]|uniref:Uncharacterized protein n=1 Tax=Stylosanthes scabra TaxID=79078 RepID=A0ABU6WMJ5_9FABA|nr:hypothetical protein [Stylosanthes scabra]
MIDVSSGGALMNKTLEEAWELIKIVADANQQFKTRATTKGVYEVTPSESTVLAKSLVDIASMLKEIKEGQQPTPTILKHQPNTTQQTPARHCGICSCNSHHTHECQGWQGNQPTRGNPVNNNSRTKIDSHTLTANHRTSKIRDTDHHIFIKTPSKSSLIKLQ